MSSMLSNFDFENTKTRFIPVTSTSAAWAIPARGTSNFKGYNALELNNIGTKACYLKFGADNSVTAVAPATDGGTLGDYCIPAGAIKVINVAGLYVGVICASGDSTSLVATPGHGS